VKASERYRRGDWNYCNQTTDGQGTTTVSFHRHGEPRGYSFRAKNFNTEKEEILEDEEVE